MSVKNLLHVVAPQSLLMMWTNRINALHRDRYREFSGRLEAGNKAELYQHLKEDSSTTSVSVLLANCCYFCHLFHLLTAVFQWRSIILGRFLTVITF